MLADNAALEKRNRQVFKWITWLAGLNILLVLLAFYLQTHVREPAYDKIAKNAQGHWVGVRMLPLASPILAKSAVINWASEAASALYTYDQAHYKLQLQAVIDNYFTPSGGASFLKALKSTGVLTQLVSERLEVTAVVEKPPAILKSGPLLGRTVWKVQMPLLVTYVTASEKQEYRFIVTMLIVKVPAWQSSRGIAIDQLWVTKT